MKALKITVVALLVIIAGLLLTIRRLMHEAGPESAASPAVAQAPANQPAPPAAEPAPAPVQPEKPSPVTPKRRVIRERSVATPSEPAPPAPAAAKSEPPAAAAPAPPAAEAPRTPPPPPAPRRATIPAGTAIVVRTQNTLSTDRNLKDDTFRATLEEPITADGIVIAERGADVEGVVTRSQRAGRVEGTAELDVELVRLHTSDGQRISIATNLHDVQGQRSRGSDAKKIGAATGIGAIIGAIAGGGKGAAIGAGVGAGAGGGAVLATRGKPSVIPSESILTFHLRTPVEVTERR
jgi:hypothetical protein